MHVQSRVIHEDHDKSCTTSATQESAPVIYLVAKWYHNDTVTQCTSNTEHKEQQQQRRLQVCSCDTTRDPDATSSIPVCMVLYHSRWGCIVLQARACGHSGPAILSHECSAVEPVHLPVSFSSHARIVIKDWPLPPTCHVPYSCCSQ